MGWALKAKAGKKPVVLELGGNAACVIDEDADIEDAIDRVIVGAYYQSGQSCISVQRLLVHSKIYDEFKSRYVEKVKALVSGDPSNEEQSAFTAGLKKQKRKVPPFYAAERETAPCLRLR